MAISNPSSDSSRSPWRRRALVGLGLLGVGGLWWNSRETKEPELDEVKSTISSHTRRTMDTGSGNTDENVFDGTHSDEMPEDQKRMMAYQEQCLKDRAAESDVISKVECDRRPNTSGIPGGESTFELDRMTCYGLDDKGNYISRTEVYVGPACDYSQGSCEVVYMAGFNTESLSEIGVDDYSNGTLPLFAEREQTPESLAKRRAILETLDPLSDNEDDPLPEEIFDEAVANSDLDKLLSEGTQTIAVADSLKGFQMADMNLLCSGAGDSLEWASDQGDQAAKNSQAMKPALDLFKASGVDVATRPDQLFHSMDSLDLAFKTENGIEMECYYNPGEDTLGCSPRVTHATDEFHTNVVEDGSCSLNNASISDLSVNDLLGVTGCSSGWVPALVWNSEADDAENCAMYNNAVSQGERISHYYADYFEENCGR